MARALTIRPTACASWRYDYRLWPLHAVMLVLFAGIEMAKIAFHARRRIDGAGLQPFGQGHSVFEA